MTCLFLTSGAVEFWSCRETIFFDRGSLGHESLTVEFIRFVLVVLVC
jgi:hypothetical protein